MSDPRSSQAVVIDPGGDFEMIRQRLERLGTRVTAILHTHTHIDHVGATAELARRLGVPIVGPHEGDRFWIEQLDEQGRMFGLGPSQSIAQASLSNGWWLFLAASVAIHLAQRRRALEQRIAPLPNWMFAAAYGTTVALVLPWMVVEYSPFIYFQF